MTEVALTWKITRVLTTANAAGTNGFSCLPKHGGARDNTFLVTHRIIDLREGCGHPSNE
jgi:hypothetical protein